MSCAEGDGFTGPWWRYPLLHNALIAGVIADAAFLLNTTQLPANNQIRALRKRSALAITDTELKLMAAAAIIGESSRPNTG